MAVPWRSASGLGGPEALAAAALTNSSGFPAASGPRMPEEAVGRAGAEVWRKKQTETQTFGFLC